MADTRTMAQLLHAPTEVYIRILIPEIDGINNFEMSMGLINLCPEQTVLRYDKEDPLLISLLQQDHSTMRIHWKLRQLGGNFFGQNARECLKIIESKTRKTASAQLLHVKAVEPKLCYIVGGCLSNQNVQHSLASLSGHILEYVSQAAAAIYKPSSSNFRPQMVLQIILDLQRRLKGLSLTSWLVAFQGPPISYSSVSEAYPRWTKDQVTLLAHKSTAPVQPPVGYQPSILYHKILMEEAMHSSPNIKGKRVNEEGENELIPTRFGYPGLVGGCMDYRTFQRCMLAIFHDMVEKTMEVFMDDFSVLEFYLKSALPFRPTCFKGVEDTILKIEVDSQIDVIAKLPHPTTVKGKLGVFSVMPVFYRQSSFPNIERIELTEAPILDCSITGTFHLSYVRCKATSPSVQVLGQRFMRTFLAYPLCCEFFCIMCATAMEALEMSIALHNGPTAHEFVMNCLTRATSRKKKTSQRDENRSSKLHPMVVKSLNIWGHRPSLCGPFRLHVWEQVYYRGSRAILIMELTHRLSTAYHHKQVGNVEVSNRGLKRILERDHRLKDFPGKTKTPLLEWPFHPSLEDFRTGNVRAFSTNGPNFKERVIASKGIYFGGNVPHLVVPDSPKLSPQGSINPCDGSSIATLNKRFVGGTPCLSVVDCPDCEDSQFCHSSRVSHLQLHLGIRYPNLID
ncbi:hypothetical protein Tco_1244628 [Tanacetum coccineum]